MDLSTRPHSQRLTSGLVEIVHLTNRFRYRPCVRSQALRPDGAWPWWPCWHVDHRHGHASFKSHPITWSERRDATTVRVRVQSRRRCGGRRARQLHTTMAVAPLAAPSLPSLPVSLYRLLKDVSHYVKLFGEDLLGIGYTSTATWVILLHAHTTQLTSFVHLLSFARARTWPRSSVPAL